MLSDEELDAMDLLSRKLEGRAPNAYAEDVPRLLAEVRELREAVGPAIDGRAWKIRAERAEGLLREAGDALDYATRGWPATSPRRQVLARIRAALSDNTEGR